MRFVREVVFSEFIHRWAWEGLTTLGWRREARSNQAFAASLRYILHMTIVKTSTFYFDFAIPARTSATLSSI
jgi:hypothetical protein